MRSSEKRKTLHRRTLCRCLGLIAPLFILACSPPQPEDVNIGFIGPLTGNAVDLGLGPAKAIELAVANYNARRTAGQPRVNLFVEDGKWDDKNAIPLYDKLRQESSIKVLMLSHTDGTIALQQKVLQDDVVMINSLNNDATLAQLNENTFAIGKKTEEAAEIIAARIAETGARKIYGFHVTNNFMETSADAFTQHLSKQNISADIVPVSIDKEDYTAELRAFKEAECDALVFFGYKNLGFAMKQARELGSSAPFYASTTTLGDGYYENAAGAMDGTEFSFFTANDGNYILANQFLTQYKDKFGADPFSVWPAMQAFDAANMLLNVIGRARDKPKSTPLNRWIKQELHRLNYYQGVCGNIAILEDGTSRGIYFSLYTVKGNGIIEKVRR